MQWINSFAGKQQVTRIALDAYSAYEKQGGKISDKVRAFRQLNLENAPSEICAYVSAFGKAGRLNDISASALQEVEVHGRSVQLDAAYDPLAKAFRVQTLPRLDLGLPPDALLSDARIIPFREDTYLLLDNARLIDLEGKQLCKLTGLLP